MTDVCTIEVLPWDSEFFGFRIGRLHGDELTPELAADARQWCHANQVSCLYFLGAAEALNPPEGFRLVDERITCRWDIHPIAGTSRAVRACQVADIEALESIPRTSHPDSRFYHD